MNASPQLTPEAVRLARIRGRVDALRGFRWLVAADGDMLAIDARGPAGDSIIIARIDPAASPDEADMLTNAQDDAAFLLTLIDRCAAKVRSMAAPAEPLPEPEPEPALDRPAKDYAAECAMKCAELAFKVFLQEVHGLDRPLTNERVVQKVRSLSGVTSRAELNDGRQAAERWKALHCAFEAWKRSGR